MNRTLLALYRPELLHTVSEQAVMPWEKVSWDSIIRPSLISRVTRPIRTNTEKERRSLAEIVISHIAANVLYTLW